MTNGKLLLDYGHNIIHSIDSEEHGLTRIPFGTTKVGVCRLKMDGFSFLNEYRIRT